MPLSRNAAKSIETGGIIQKRKIAQLSLVLSLGNNQTPFAFRYTPLSKPNSRKNQTQNPQNHITISGKNSSCSLLTPPRHNTRRTVRNFQNNHSPHCQKQDRSETKKKKKKTSNSRVKTAKTNGRGPAEKGQFDGELPYPGACARRRSPSTTGCGRAPIRFSPAGHQRISPCSTRTYGHRLGEE